MPPDTLRFVREGRNVIVLRTFSKIHGLANVRLGYGIARPELIKVLQKTREPFNANGIAQAGALASLADEDASGGNETRDRRRPPLSGGRICARWSCPSSRAWRISSSSEVGDGKAVFKALLKKGVIVRALKGYKFPEWVRISVGTMEQNRKCIAALREVLCASAGERRRLACRVRRLQCPTH